MPHKQLIFWSDKKTGDQAMNNYNSTFFHGHFSNVSFGLIMKRASLDEDDEMEVPPTKKARKSSPLTDNNQTRQNSDNLLVRSTSLQVIEPIITEKDKADMYFACRGIDGTWSKVSKQFESIISKLEKMGLSLNVVNQEEWKIDFQRYCDDIIDELNDLMDKCVDKNVVKEIKQRKQTVEEQKNLEFVKNAYNSNLGWIVTALNAQNYKDDILPNTIDILQRKFDCCLKNEQYSRLQWSLSDGVSDHWFLKRIPTLKILNVLDVDIHEMTMGPCENEGDCSIVKYHTNHNFGK